MKVGSDIGIVGLATMGQNLCLNFLSKGYHIAAWNLEPEPAKEFAKEQKDALLVVCGSLEGLVQRLERPRKIIILIQSGEPVDEMIGQLQKILEPGDVLIDAGNSHFLDTERRFESMKNLGIEFVGLGISGGPE